MTTECPVEFCNRPRHPNLAICTQHAWLLERALAELPALARELDLTITRQTSSGPREGSRAATRPLPFDLTASEALSVLRGTLGSWVREIAEMRPSLPWPADTLDAISTWLYLRHHQLVIHPDADQAVGEITAATANGWRCTDRRDRARLTLPDPCPDCGHTLHAVLHDIGDPRPNLVWCAGPESHRWEPVQWLRLGHRLGYGREAG